MTDINTSQEMFEKYNATMINNALNITDYTCRVAGVVVHCLYFISICFFNAFRTRQFLFLHHVNFISFIYFIHYCAYIKGYTSSLSNNPEINDIFCNVSEILWIILKFLRLYSLSLLALLESNDDLTNGERIISGIKLDDLLDEIKNVFNHKSPNNSIQMEYILKFISKLIDKFQEVFPNAIEVSQSISPRKAHYFNRIWSQTFKFIKEKLLADSQIAGWVNRWKDIKDEQLNIQLNKQDDNDNTNDDDDDDDDQLAADVGHNLYMLSHQLAKFNKDFASKLKQTSKEEDENGALTYYAAHTAQIEVLFYYYIEKIRYII